MTPYESYFERPGFGLGAHRNEAETRTWSREDIGPKTVVLGIERDGHAVGVPRPVVEGQLHAFEDPAVDLSVEAGTVSGGGTTWDPVTGEAADGPTLTRVPTRRLFAFTWQDDHGADAFYVPS